MEGKPKIMKHKTENHTFALFLAILIFYAIGATPVLAEGYKQHSAHVHGTAHLNVAMENNELYIEFVSPAADIVGFEHTPETEDEKAAMQKAAGKLRVGKRMFEFPASAGVRFEKAVVKTGLPHKCEDESHDHGEDDHGEHSDVAVEYRFHCETPGKLKYINVKLFKYFKTLEKINVQMLTETKQTAVELTHKNTRITF